MKTKTYTGYTVEKDSDNEILVHFDGHKDCSCGIGYTIWGEVDENELGYWFTCPICKSTSLLPKK